MVKEWIMKHNSGGLFEMSLKRIWHGNLRKGCSCMEKGINKCIMFLRCFQKENIKWYPVEVLNVLGEWVGGGLGGLEGGMGEWEGKGMGGLIFK